MPKKQAGRSDHSQQLNLITQEIVIIPERIVKCLKCGLIYANPRMTESFVSGKYKNMIDEDYIKEEVGRRKTARRILRRIQKYTKGKGSLLEIGCAVGFLLDEAQKDGWQVQGVDVSQWAVDYAKEKFGLNVLLGNLKEVGLPQGHFDAIILSDTIEHINFPKEVLIKIRSLLSPQGVLYINTPNIDSLVSRVLRAKWWGLNQLHLYYFTKNTLSQMLEAAGFDTIVWKSSYSRTFSLSYWLKKIRGYNKKIFNLLNYLLKKILGGNRLISINIGDQIEVIAKRQRKIAYLSEIERETKKEKREDLKVTAVLPAYNAANTLQRTVKDIPKDIVGEIILVDDASSDNTVEVANKLGLVVFRHEKNKGYGANQKTCYIKALERGADIVVMVHPDYQYDPTAIPQMVEPIQKGEADAVFGSRMLKGGALEGGMPLWKHNANIIITAFSNVILRTYLTEYHSGFRAYSAELLRSINFMDNSDSFVFDTEIIVQILVNYFRISEVPIRTRYFQEASVITLSSGIRYGLGILKTLFKCLVHRYTFVKFDQFK